MKNLQNQKIAKYSLTELLIDCNARTTMIKWYLETANKAGKKDNFVGAYLVSEWYRRNLYMYSLIQKLTENKDAKIMVLLGAGHTAMLREFIKYDSDFEIVELKDSCKIILNLIQKKILSFHSGFSIYETHFSESLLFSN